MWAILNIYTVCFNRDFVYQIRPHQLQDWGLFLGQLFKKTWRSQRKMHQGYLKVGTPKLLFWGWRKIFFAYWSNSTASILNKEDKCIVVLCLGGAMISRWFYVGVKSKEKEIFCKKKKNTINAPFFFFFCTIWKMVLRWVTRCLTCHAFKIVHVHRMASIYST